jgi:excisionase family DNA binding protein
VETTDITWLTLQQAADRAQLSTATLRREARHGRLPATRVGGRRTYRFRPDWIDAWLDRYAVSGCGRDD